MDYLIGHLIGDYLLQNDWQAMHKKLNSLKGWTSCLIHCWLYTIAVCLCTGWCSPFLIGLVFLSHFPIDKTYVVAWFMKKVGIFKRIINNKDTEIDPVCTGNLLAFQQEINKSNMNHKVWAYLLVDNTAHLTLLWLIAKFAV